jgi:hypothetical protein
MYGYEGMGASHSKEESEFTCGKQTAGAHRSVRIRRHGPFLSGSIFGWQIGVTHDT